MPNPATMQLGYFDPQTNMFYPSNQIQQQAPYTPPYQPPIYTSPSQPTLPQTSQPSSTNSNPSSPLLKGRVVEDISEVKPGEVSMDGVWHYYPKRDGTKVYIKLWDQEGELRTFTFIPEEPIIAAQKSEEQSKYDEILRRLNDISESISSKKSAKKEG